MGVPLGDRVGRLLVPKSDDKIFACKDLRIILFKRQTVGPVEDCTLRIFGSTIGTTTPQLPILGCNGQNGWWEFTTLGKKPTAYWARFIQGHRHTATAEGFRDAHRPRSTIGLMEAIDFIDR